MLDYLYEDTYPQHMFFYKVPWLLFKNPVLMPLSDSAKLLYSVFFEKQYSSSKENGWCDEFDRLYIIYPTEEIMKDMGYSKSKVIKVIKELKKIKLIETVRRGLGKPNLIYVKKLT
jgi:hypothetical protein